MMYVMCVLNEWMAAPPLCRMGLVRERVQTSGAVTNRDGQSNRRDTRIAREKQVQNVTSVCGV